MTQKAEEWLYILAAKLKKLLLGNREVPVAYLVEIYQTSLRNSCGMLTAVVK